MATPVPGVLYPGPQCPWCNVALAADDVRSGAITCGACSNTFEATAFTPPDKRARTIEVAVSGPEGANACANHARNAAVTSCERCGLFICSLCEMNVGDGAMCPSCFQRARADGSLHGVAGRIRDYAQMAKLSMVFSLLILFLGIPLGILAMVYARKAMKQRREVGDGIAGMVGVMIVSGLSVLGGLTLVTFMVIGAMQ